MSTAVAPNKTTTASSFYPLPSFYHPKKVSDIYMIDYPGITQEARQYSQNHQIKPFFHDSTRICLLGIDIQNTFVQKNGELPVTGALDDTIRTCDFIYKNLGRITTLTMTLDTHRPIQIFHEIFWVDEDGNHPTPGTQITAEQVHNAKWKPNIAVAHALGVNVATMEHYARHYCDTLESNSRPTLTIWPYHSDIFSPSYSCPSILTEAIHFHSIARNAQPLVETKGGNPWTENYAATGPEVLKDHKGNVVAQKNVAFIDRLLNNDIVIIAGQAKSHCVALTIRGILDDILTKDSKLAKKIYLLEDCTSPVIIPNVIDFTQMANDAFNDFAKHGMHIVKSTDPIESWPDVSL